MLEFLAPKKGEFSQAKWQSAEDVKRFGYFKFSKVDVLKENKTSVSNMTASNGSVVWETKSSLPFKTDDICWFEGQKYFIVDVGKDDKESQVAHLYFNNNGNVKKLITLSKAG